MRYSNILHRDLLGVSQSTTRIITSGLRRYVFSLGRFDEPSVFDFQIPGPLLPTSVIYISTLAVWVEPPLSLDPPVATR
jgi:hypothetical protein